MRHWILLEDTHKNHQGDWPTWRQPHSRYASCTWRTKPAQCSWPTQKQTTCMRCIWHKKQWCGTMHLSVSDRHKLGKQTQCVWRTTTGHLTHTWPKGICLIAICFGNCFERDLIVETVCSFLGGTWESKCLV